MPPLSAHDLENVAIVFNAQPHINVCADDLKEVVLSRNLALDDPTFGYCLQHKHFDLEPKEFLLYTFNADESVNIRAEKMKLSDLFPCLWFSWKGKFVPIGFTHDAEKSLIDIPIHSVSHEGIAICSPAFARGYMEDTDEDSKQQTLFRYVEDPIDSQTILTMHFPALLKCDDVCKIEGYCLDVAPNEHRRQTPHIRR